MSCEAVRDLLPDYTLGTLSEIETTAVRRHLRGCAACRSEASSLDQGVALFAQAAHDAEPPAELKDRVMAVLADEWSESPAAPARPRRWLAMASVAAAVALVGALVWGGLAQTRSDRLASEAASYQRFLHALGGRDVRVAAIHPRSPSSMQGSAVFYDSDVGQSWVLVLLRSPGAAGTVNVTLVGDAYPIHLRPVQLGQDGDGATWLVTSSDISSIRRVEVTDVTGRVLASGATPVERS